MNHLFWTVIGILVAANLAMADIAPPKADVIPESFERKASPIRPATDLAPPEEKRDVRPAEPIENAVNEVGVNPLLLALGAGVLVLGIGGFVVLRTRKNESDPE